MSYDVVLPEKVDVIVSEILGNLADNQEMTPILEDARKRFLKVDGVFIPKHIETYIVPISSPAIHDQVKRGVYRNLNDSYSLDTLKSRFGVTDAFDMPFNAIIPKSTYLSDPQVVKEFTFNGKDESEYATSLVYKIHAAGTFTGFKGYFVAQLSPNSILDISGDNIENRKTSDCWKHLYLPVQEPFEVEEGDELHLTYERFYPKDHVKDFVQGYAWRGNITRGGQIVFEFSQKLG